MVTDGELDLIRPKEQIMALTFILDSQPSYILLVSKIIQPRCTDADSPGIQDTLPKDGIMFRILSFNTTNEDEDSAQEAYLNHGLETPVTAKYSNVGAVPTCIDTFAPDESAIFGGLMMEDGETTKSMKSRVSTLIDQSSKQYMEEKIIEQMEQNKVDLT